MRQSSSQTYKKLLSKALQFQSVSTDPAYKADVRKTAQWLKKTFEEKNFAVQIIDGYDNPIVFAEYTVDEKAGATAKNSVDEKAGATAKNDTTKSVLIYGHYDVQPAEQSEGWNSNPFSLYEAKGYSSADKMEVDKYYGRGVVDNKGQFLIHIAAIFDLIESQELKYNVKFMIEGNEETGSPNLEKFVEDYKDLLTADYIMISDGEIKGNHPVIEVGFRGVLNATFTFKTSHTDLHSGLYGGVSPSSVHELMKFLSGIFEGNDHAGGTVQIPGFYDGVSDFPTEARENNESIPFSEEDYCAVTGTKTYFTEKDTDFYSQVGLRPSFEVTGIQSGYTGVGYRNGIPHSAMAKVNIRLVDGQNAENIAEAVQKYVADVVPDYVDAEVEIGESAPAILLDTKGDKIFEHVDAMLEKIYGEKVLYSYCGGSIPIVQTFKDLIGAPQLLIPLGNEDCNMHGANENFAVKLVEKGLQFSKAFFAAGQTRI